MGGQSLAQNSPLTSLWNVRENETLGFMHPYFRDGRARGIAIVCDEVTGCGHDLHGWEFYRDTRVLNGSVAVEMACDHGQDSRERVGCSGGGREA